MLCIADMGSMEVQVNLNENDIAKVCCGDSAEIRVDALQGRLFCGIVTSIGCTPVGEEYGYSGNSSSGGITEYPVKVAIVGERRDEEGQREKMCVIDIPEGCEESEDEMFNAPIGMPLILFNPEIIAQEGSQRDREGCLSFPNVGGSLTRAAQVTCQYLDADNRPQMITARGFLARALQHEIDHLNGILYVDHMSAVERLTYAQKLKRLAAANGGAR